MIKTLSSNILTVSILQLPVLPSGFTSILKTVVMYLLHTLKN